MTTDELKQERDRLTRQLKPHLLGICNLPQDSKRRLLLEVAMLRAGAEAFYDLRGPADGVPAQPQLQLERDPVQLTVVQRYAEHIPGSRGSIIVAIGDVTGGQVLVEVVKCDGSTLAGRMSMKPGDVREFPVQGRDYYLTLTALQNYLIGDDFAVFEISADRPSKKRLDAMRKGSQPPQAENSIKPEAPAGAAGGP
jgi:hypothetical protein